jgi:hypothetical protein
MARDFPNQLNFQEACRESFRAYSQQRIEANQDLAALLQRWTDGTATPLSNTSSEIK